MIELGDGIFRVLNRGAHRTRDQVAVKFVDGGFELVRGTTVDLEDPDMVDYEVPGLDTDLEAAAALPAPVDQGCIIDRLYIAAMFCADDLRGVPACGLSPAQKVTRSAWVQALFA